MGGTERTRGEGPGMESPGRWPIQEPLGGDRGRGSKVGLGQGKEREEVRRSLGSRAPEMKVCRGSAEAGMGRVLSLEARVQQRSPSLQPKISTPPSSALPSPPPPQQSGGHCSLTPQHPGQVPSLFLHPTSFLIGPALLASPRTPIPTASLPMSCLPSSPLRLGPCWSPLLDRPLRTNSCLLS